MCVQHNLYVCAARRACDAQDGVCLLTLPPTIVGSRPTVQQLPEPASSACKRGVKPHNNVQWSVRQRLLLAIQQAKLWVQLWVHERNECHDNSVLIVRCPGDDVGRQLAHCATALARLDAPKHLQRQKQAAAGTNLSAFWDHPWCAAAARLPAGIAGQGNLYVGTRADNGKRQSNPPPHPMNVRCRRVDATHSPGRLLPQALVPPAPVLTNVWAAGTQQTGPY